MTRLKHTLLLCLIFLLTKADAQKNAREYYQLTVYQYSSAAQETALNDYFQNALLPTLHRLGITRVGAFSNLANDTAKQKKMYVLIPFRGPEQWISINDQLSTDAAYQKAAAAYMNAPNKAGVYDRMETILMKAFTNAPVLQKPGLTNTKTDRVYELRSYESGTEKLFHNKVEMFNKGGEVGIFKRLGFNAVFYGEVIAGASMPNLMYMTTHADMAARDRNWKSFSTDAGWNQLKVDPAYQDNVSRIEINFLKARPYSDL
ncbi:NIPSNAP family protein [Niabella yanshanensis]|uniref:NIPSNAP family protein n=1 Tax=Niabella yanshanensis TaxID=577386 RepID=A0ABZ0W061_9BACT|nr:NIPSNAP family protein [Niabella yanshanensis]WQD36309.1 NIPSNAP family protein [Niabella yanshanensis]